MLWKSVKLPLKLIQAIKTSSITVRLTFLYSLSAFFILVLAGLFLYNILLNGLAKDDENFLGDEITVLRTLVQQGPVSVSALQQELKEITHYRYAVRILDQKGREITVTPNMSVATTEFPKPVFSTQFPTATLWMHDNHFLLMSTWARVRDTNTYWKIQVALDLAREYNIIKDYRNNLIMVLLLGVLGFAVIGTFVAKRGLSPLNNIANKTEGITIAHLDRRIEADYWPKEIIGLVDALNKMLERIEAAFTRLTQFSADLAHELRTPIGNLMGEAEVALSRARTSEEYRTVLESSLEEFQRLSRMIESMLFLARSENPQTQVQYLTFNAHQAIASIVEYYGIVASEKNISIVCQGGAMLSADPILFRRAINNLLSNALQYTLSNGKITIKISQPNAQHVQITVKDTGEGMTEAHLSKIFDRFYRTDVARSKHSGGTGLGLAIVKSIMELHNGSIDIASQVGVGTTITLLFPINAPQ